MKKYIKDGCVKQSDHICVKTWIEEEEVFFYNPPEELILDDGWMPYDDRQERYKLRIIELIRERYSFDDEIAILRQMTVKPEEFEAYNAYAEECKATARKEIFDEPAS